MLKQFQSVIYRIPIIFILLISHLCCVDAGAYESPPLTNSRIVMLGDSITNRCDWSELLSRNDIVNQGIGGDTTAGLLNRLNQIISLKPEKVFLMIGTNDLGEGAPVSDTLSNYQKIITKLLAANIEVYVQSTLYVGRKSSIERNLKIKELNDGLKIYCKYYGVKFIDLNITLAPDGLLLDEYSEDGVHLTGAAYLKWKDAIIPFLP